MWLARNEVEPSVLRLDAFDHKPLRLFVTFGRFDRDPLDLLVAHHRLNLRVLALGVRKDESPADLPDIPYRTVTFLLELPPARLETVVEIVDVLFGLGYEAIEAGDSLPLDLAIQILRKLVLRAIDECCRLISTCLETISISCSRCAELSRSHFCRAS